MRHLSSSLIVLALLGAAGCKEQPPAAPRRRWPPRRPPPRRPPPAPLPPPSRWAPRAPSRAWCASRARRPGRRPWTAPLDPACDAQVPDETVLVKDGKLANVLVRLTGALPRVAVPTVPVVIDQQGCTYRPRVQGAMAGQTIQIRNSDGTLHNVHSYAGARTLFNRAQPPGARPMDTTFPPGTEVVKLKCDVHPWMLGWVVVGEHPWHAVSGADGRFELAGGPGGDLDRRGLARVPGPAHRHGHGEGGPDGGGRLHLRRGPRGRRRPVARARGSRGSGECGPSGIRTQAKSIMSRLLYR